jgi:hypothetical protein
VPRKSKAFLRRSAAAKKGWRRRRSRRTWFVTLAYKARTPGNGFICEFEVTPRKILTGEQVIKLTTELMQVGFFDNAEANDSRELRWATPLINFEMAIPRPREHKLGTAYLVNMERQ